MSSPGVSVALLENTAKAGKRPGAHPKIKPGIEYQGRITFTLGEGQWAQRSRQKRAVQHVFVIRAFWWAMLGLPTFELVPTPFIFCHL